MTAQTIGSRPKTLTLEQRKAVLEKYKGMTVEDGYFYNEEEHYWEPIPGLWEDSISQPAGS